MDWNYYINKKIFVILKNKRQYSGIVLEVFKEGNPTIIFMKIKDMKERPVVFPTNQIEVIEEEGF